MTLDKDGRPLTVPQQRAYDFLNEHAGRYGVAPGTMARLMWPDSPGWEKVSRRHATPAGGAKGATMAMKAATLLWRLRDKGLAYSENYKWFPLPERSAPPGRDRIPTDGSAQRKAGISEPTARRKAGRGDAAEALRAD